MKRMFFAIGFVCFFAVFGFSFVDQSFAQQDSQPTAEVEEFTEKDQSGLEKALEEERWETAVFYLEKKQRFFKGVLENTERMVDTIGNAISAQGGDPKSDPEMVVLRDILSSCRNILDDVDYQIKEMKKVSRLLKGSATRSV